MNNHQEPFWFKRKLYGWGWVPSTWQGWLVLVVYVALFIFFATPLDKNSMPKEIFFYFVLPVFIATSLLIRICYLKGEKPRWQWGKDIEDK